MDSLFKALILPITIFITVICAGTFGYMYFYQINLIDALQLVMVTIATCGFRTAGTTTAHGKIFDIIFIIISFIVMISVFSKTLSLVLEGQIKGIKDRQKMRKTLEKIKDHYIVCGFGRVGIQVSKQLIQQKIPVVVIDTNLNSVMEEKLKNLKVPYILGSISSDEVLRKAHIEHAKGLVACADSDIENVFSTLSARTINPNLNIIARASDPTNENKLRHAGANHIVSPYVTTGQKISAMILNPSVTAFLDNVLHDQNLEVWFKEVKLPKKTKLANQTLKELDLRKKAGIIILSIRRADGHFELNPDANTRLQNEDTFICIGTNAQIATLKKLF